MLFAKLQIQKLFRLDSTLKQLFGPGHIQAKSSSRFNCVGKIALFIEGHVEVIPPLAPPFEGGEPIKQPQ